MSKSSVFDEYIKIAAEKGWAIDEGAYSSVVDKVKQDVHKSVEEKVQNMPKGPAETAIDAAKEKAKELIEKQKGKVTTLPETKVETKIPKSGAWVIGVQNVLNKKTPLAIKVDGYWGPKTAAAWNALVSTHKGLINAVDPSGKQVPHGSDIKWVKDAYPNIFAMGLPKGEHKRSIHDKTTGRYQEVEPTYQDRASRGLRSDDADVEAEDKTMTLKRNAEVVKELVTLANDLEELGAEKVAQVVDKETKRFKKAMDGLYDVTGETGENLIEEAHPGGGPVIAPSQEEGGKIETIVEEQQKNIKKVLKDPTGKYAKYIKELVVLANKFENEGKVAEAKMIDKTISELHEAAQRPFLSKGLVSGATKSNNIANPIEKNASEEEFKNNFSAEVSSLIGFLQSTQEDIEFIDNLYREPIRNLTNILNQFGTLSVQDIYNKTKGQLKVLTTNIGNLVNADGTQLDKMYHRKTLQFASKLVNDMLAFVKKVAPKQQDPKEIAEPKVEEKGIAGRAKADYLKQLDQLDKLIQKFPYKMSKVLGGDEQLLGMEKWIVNQRYNTIEAPDDYEYKFSPELADAAKLKAYTISLFKAIKQMDKGAQVRFTFKKTASAIPPFQPVTTTAPAKAKSKKPGAKRRKKLPFDPKVQKLQQEMSTVEGLPTLKRGRGGRPDDGVWGPSTAAVYSALMAKLKSVNPRAKAYSVTKDKPNVNVIDWGFHAAKYLKEKKEEAGLDNIKFPVYSTFGVPASMLKSADVFVNFIDQNKESLPPNVISKVPSVSLDTDKVVDPWIKGKLLASVVLKDITKLLFDMSFIQDLVTSTGDKDIVNKLKVLVNNLWKELSPHLQSPGTTKPEAEGRPKSEKEKELLELSKLVRKPGGFLYFKNIDDPKKFFYAFQSLPRPPYKSVLLGIAETNNTNVNDVIYKLGKLVRSLLAWLNANREEFSARFRGGKEKLEDTIEELVLYHRQVENEARKLKYYDITKSPQKEIYKKVW